MQTPIQTCTNEILEKYTSLLADLDKKTGEVYTNAPEIPCRNKCFDCCQQLFPISFVEAFLLSQAVQKMDRKTRRERTRIAEKINEKILEKKPSQLEKHAVDKISALRTHNEFARLLHTIKSDCPALNPKNKDGACTVYEARNHDCRTMGFSFDALSSENPEIIGCFRYANLKHLLPKLMDYNYRYREKMQLDRMLIKEITNSSFTENIYYYTTMCGPFLKDYEKTDWTEFFTTKNIPTETKNEYYVIIDV